MMSGAWNVMRWAKLRAIAKVARLRWMMGILPNLRGFVNGTSIRWGFFLRGGTSFSRIFALGVWLRCGKSWSWKYASSEFAFFENSRGQEDDLIFWSLPQRHCRMARAGW